ncbi:DUF6279 family lipoprotein [Haliea sp. E1-2-M8]|uniref:DUF6279 family lipoprotein n=1 Tax=Haliea sp. E1-2-M8 TaxID=3064706 RepID=UPI00271ABF59|nr:DUF6279 family lipoprotein [Haliea sp. E1-2-M8]MDO8862792.1 DUF6279 family lipoprotein [Haliea sp. E1-2-M8]
MTTALPARAGARLWILALLLVCLAGCSSTRFAYNRLDFLVPWYLGDYVSLDRDQGRLLKSELQAFLAWHRQQELPRYIALLDRVEGKLDRELTAADMRILTEEAEVAIYRLQDRALDWMLALGEDLRDQQMAEFIAGLREQQDEYEEEYLERDEAEYRDDACERLRDNARKYIGRLQREQKAGLAAACAELRRSDSLWLEARAQWIGRLDLILQREPGWQADLREALETRGETVSADYRSTYDHNTLVIQLAVAGLLNSRTERQDAHLRRELGKLRRDLVALVEQGEQEAEAVVLQAN